jgi:hypothetical protein
MTTTGYRIVYTILGVLFAGVVAGAIFLIPSGDEAQLPDAVESFSPGEGDLVVQPVRVVLDLRSGYEASLVIDGIPIPEDQIDAIPQTGRYQFEPAPGKVIERWTPGEHTVVATYVGGANSLDAGTIVWTFRIQ